MTKNAIPAGSQSSSFIDLFARTVGSAIISPPEYVWWSGVCAVSALMGRLIHTHTFVRGPHDHLYGNVFVIMVGRPGAGKTKAISEARAVVRQCGARVGPDDITGEKLYDFLGLKEGQPPQDCEAAPGTFSLFLDEFDSLMHGGMSRAAKNLLNHCYDCRSDQMVRSTYAHGDQKLSDLCLTMAAGCTPAHLASSFEPMEWQEGLPSRLIMVWGEKPPFRTEYRRGSMEVLMRAAEQLQAFIALHTSIEWSREALPIYTEWCSQNWEAKSPHPLLTGYTARRHLHLAKLAFILAVARQSEQIELEDFHRARAALEGVDAGLPSALALSGGNSFSDVEDYLKETLVPGEVVEESVILRIIYRRAEFEHGTPILNALLAAQILKEEPPFKAQGRRRIYLPEKSND